MLTIEQLTKKRRVTLKNSEASQTIGMILNNEKKRIFLFLRQKWVQKTDCISQAQGLAL
ncbi:MAG: hypothetical protein ACRCWB_05620 [Enterovibrio sp.]